MSRRRSDADAPPHVLRPAIRLLAIGALSTTASCLHVEVGETYSLKGRTVIEWVREDGFIYRKKLGEPLTFQASFMKEPIIPEDMYTDGGSVPRMFWSIPGLSPWGLGPAYIIHDWIFKVHLCPWTNKPEAVAALTFEESAKALAEVAAALVDAGLIDNDLRGAVVAAVNSPIARRIWDGGGEDEDCRTPPTDAAFKTLGVEDLPVVYDLAIPPVR